MRIESAGDRMRIVIADSRPEIRSALRLIIEHRPEHFVVGEVINARDLVAKVQADQPDLVLLEWEIAEACAAGSIGESGGELLLKLRALCPGLKVIALSSQPRARKEALSAGSDAFVSKGDPPEYLIAALSEICAGDTGQSRDN